MTSSPTLQPQLLRQQKYLKERKLIYSIGLTPASTSVPSAKSYCPAAATLNNSYHIQKSA